jgi:cell division septation protein DedD
MSRTQKERQQTFRQKLQSEGADSFADGPRPWEQWDESGIQGDNRVWEGTARRIYPQRKAARGFGDRLLSGLAVIALGSMLVGIAGVILSTPSTPRQASSTIQPPPIIASKTTVPAAAVPAATVPAEPADTPTPVIAQLETLSPPAAGIPAPPRKPQTILEPTMARERSTSPVIQTDNVDRVAVETVITEGAVTTTVYTRQPSQEEPELVAMVATNAPPFAHTAAQREETPFATAMETTQSGQSAAPAVASMAVAPTGGMEAVVDASTVARTDVPAVGPADIEQATAEDIANPTVEETTTATPTPVTESPIINSETAIVAQNTAVVTAPVIVAQTDAITSQQRTVEEAQDVVTTPAAVEQALPAVTTPTRVEHPAEEATASNNVAAQAGTADTAAAAAPPPLEVVTGPAAIEQAAPAVTEPAIVEQTTEEATASSIVAQAGTADTEAATVKETLEVVTTTAAPVVEQAPAEITAPADAATAVALNTPATAAETTPVIAAEVAATQAPVLPVAKTGKWVINLSSYTHERTAERMLAVFQKKGVDAEVFATTINDKPMYRIRVAGFASARSAKAEISTLEKQLGLEGAWVSKR